jgi:putative DNA primase/helicase
MMYRIQRIAPNQYTIIVADGRETTVNADLENDRGRGELLMAVVNLLGNETNIIAKAKRYIAHLAAGPDSAGPDVDEIQDVLRVAAEERPLPATSRTTDVANGERFADHWRDRFKWMKGFGWVEWGGRRWRIVVTNLLPAAAEVARKIYREAEGESDRKAGAALARWADASQNIQRLQAMTKYASGLLAKDVVSFDADPFALNVMNGILDLRTGRLKPHDPRALCTKLAPVHFDPNASAPRFLQFLHRIFNGNAGLISFVQQWLGYCVTGDNNQQILAIFHGEGANGKSTLLAVVVALLGDYAGIAPDSLLTVSKQHQHPTDLAGLRELRLVVASETEGNGKLRIELIKRMTGEEMLVARLMRQDFCTFKRTFKILLQTNHRPRVNDDGEAVWRRLRLIPFNVVIPESERDAALSDKLKAESSGILNWLLEGCLAVLANGLTCPPEVMEATRLYREESDGIGEWLSECCLKNSRKDFTSTADLRRSYEAWCQEQGDLPVTGKTMAERLRKWNCVPGKRAGVRGWFGLQLVDASAR